MKDRTDKKMNLMEDPSQMVAEQLLSLARIIRRRGTPEEAQVAAAWEQILQRAIDQRELPKAA